MWVHKLGKYGECLPYKPASAHDFPKGGGGGQVPPLPASTSALRRTCHFANDHFAVGSAGPPTPRGCAPLNLRQCATSFINRLLQREFHGNLNTRLMKLLIADVVSHRMYFSSETFVE